MCLCKTIDVYLWKGFTWKLNFRTIVGLAVLGGQIQLQMIEKILEKDLVCNTSAVAVEHNFECRFCIET